jgi:hypothetical protein
MATTEQALAAAGVDWRTFREYTARRAATLTNTVFTPPEERTSKKRRDLLVAQLHTAGRAARASNVSHVGGGRYHTSKGVRAT